MTEENNILNIEVCLFKKKKEAKHAKELRWKK